MCNMTLIDPPLSKIAPRQIGAMNFLGLWTLYSREVKRFLNVFTQTLMAPVITTLLFLAVFALALGGLGRTVGGVDYITFLAPGLMMMTMTQNSFANTSSSILIAKVQGNIVDILMPPLAPWEMTLAIAAGGVTRGLLVGLTVFVAMLFFVPSGVAHPLSALWFAVNACLMLSLLGMLGGIWAQKYDHIAAVTNFVITPLSFLSGTFYSIDRLPEAWVAVAHFNPFFYMIDGFRYGFIGHADGNVIIGYLLLPCVNLLLWLLTHRLISIGYRLKA
ncbi:ABC transporter permease [Kiloniella laminariae]|uniref:ABC transporter permease n=1 Tax=Kiloniella laminariae TaxID=454162 RepID=UPI00035F4EA5